jgi:hypothetical protein
MQARNLFTDHPSTVGETYTEHMGVAFSFAGHMLLGALACFVHGIFPFLFVRTGSRTVTRLYERMVTHRDRRRMPAPVPAE